MPEDFTYPKGSLSSHMAKMLKTQSAMIDFKANIHRLHPFYFDPKKVIPQEVAAHDEEFIVGSIMSHQGDLTKKASLTFKVRWLGYTADFDSWEP